MQDKEEVKPIYGLEAMMDDKYFLKKPLAFFMGTL